MPNLDRLVEELRQELDEAEKSCPASPGCKTGQHWRCKGGTGKCKKLPWSLRRKMKKAETSALKAQLAANNVDKGMGSHDEHSAAHAEAEKTHKAAAELAHKHGFGELGSKLDDHGEDHEIEKLHARLRSLGKKPPEPEKSEPKKSEPKKSEPKKEPEKPTEPKAAPKKPEEPGDFFKKPPAPVPPPTVKPGTTMVAHPPPAAEPAEKPAPRKPAKKKKDDEDEWIESFDSTLQEVGADLRRTLWEKEPAAAGGGYKDPSPHFVPGTGTGGKLAADDLDQFLQQADNAAETAKHVTREANDATRNADQEHDVRRKTDLHSQASGRHQAALKPYAAAVRASQQAAQAAKQAGQDDVAQKYTELAKNQERTRQQHLKAAQAHHDHLSGMTAAQGAQS